MRMAHAISRCWGTFTTGVPLGSRFLEQLVALAVRLAPRLLVSQEGRPSQVVERRAELT
jgi:hypothetical protein